MLFYWPPVTKVQKRSTSASIWGSKAFSPPVCSFNKGDMSQREEETLSLSSSPSSPQGFVDSFLARDRGIRTLEIARADAARAFTPSLLLSRYTPVPAVAPAALSYSMASTFTRVALVLLLCAASASAFFASSGSPILARSMKKPATMGYGPSDLIAEQWRSIQSKEKLARNDLGKVGVQKFKSRSTEAWQKGGQQHLFPVGASLDDVWWQLGQQ
ncbi:unnamed protein product [Chrysoparadoxa australica]